MEENTFIIWIDTETTGFSPSDNDVIQVAIIVDFNGKVVSSHMFYMQPHSFENVNQDAVDVHGITALKMAEFPLSHWAQPPLTSLFTSIKNAGGVIAVGGHNVMYDVRMMRGYLEKCGGFEPVFDAAAGKNDDVHVGIIDVMKFANDVTGCGKKKLGELCKVHGVFYSPNESENCVHDARDDIDATRRLYYRLCEIQAAKNDVADLRCFNPRTSPD